VILVKVAGIACFSIVFRVFVPGRFTCFSLDCRAISVFFARFSCVFARFRDESVGAVQFLSD
jgi:hypothetical protein